MFTHFNNQVNVSAGITRLIAVYAITEIQVAFIHFILYNLCSSFTGATTVYFYTLL